MSIFVDESAHKVGDPPVFGALVETTFCCENDTDVETESDVDSGIPYDLQVPRPLRTVYAYEQRSLTTRRNCKVESTLNGSKFYIQ